MNYAILYPGHGYIALSEPARGLIGGYEFAAKGRALTFVSVAEATLWLVETGPEWARKMNNSKSFLVEQM